jgi:DNA ligase (NAD+)
MNIEGLGESLVDQLVTTGLVHDYADLYASTSSACGARTDGKKSATNLVAEIEKQQARGSVAVAARDWHSSCRRTWCAGAGVGVHHDDALRAAPSVARSRADVGPVVARWSAVFWTSPQRRSGGPLAQRGTHGLDLVSVPTDEPKPLAGKTYVITDAAPIREAAAAR